MDKQSNSIIAPIVSSDFAGMAASDLDTIFDAIKGANDAICAIHNQPRCSVAASEFINDFSEHLGWQLDAIVKAAGQLEITDPDEVEARAWLTLKSDLKNNGGLAEFAAMAARFASDMSRAEFHKRHKAGGRL